tara:strand:- start:453 stop:656 length:204 start_codon:yes stop_codon:yes gene_type:complete
MAEHQTIPEVAKAIGINRQTLWRWVKSGQVESVRFTATSNLLIPACEVERLLKEAGKLRVEENGPTV